jgi:hypothetical protein
MLIRASSCRPARLLAVAGLALLLAACSRQETAPTAAPAAVAPEGGAETSPLLSVPPQGLVWSQPGVTDARRQDDIQDCYAFARARVRTGQQIQSDIEGNLNQRGGYAPTRQFQDRLDDFEARNRQDRLFRDCMQSKGYVRGAPPDQAQPAQ